MLRTVALAELEGDAPLKRIGSDPATVQEENSDTTDDERATPDINLWMPEPFEKRPVYGVGRNWNDEMGVGTFRTGGEMQMKCTADFLRQVARRNIIEFCKDPEHSLRLFVQGKDWWFSDASGEEIADRIMIDTSSTETCRDIRRRDSHGDLVPVCLCVVEPRESAEDGSPQASIMWIFRHDVIDGWRSLRYLFTTGFDTKILLYDVLKQRGDAKKAKAKKMPALVKAGRALGRGLAAVALTPAALLELSRIASVRNTGERRKFYAHIVADTQKLKHLGKQHELGGLSNVLSAVITEAYFAADPTQTRANVANAVLFNPDSPHGNHMCTKICSVPRKGNSLKKTASLLSRASQRLTDAWVIMGSRAFALGHLSKRTTKWIEERQKQLDFLVSSLPGTECSEPACADLQVCREFTTWAPSIIYCLGLGGQIYMDFYWEVKPTFDDEIFLRTIVERVQAVRHHTNLPSMY